MAGTHGAETDSIDREDEQMTMGAPTNFEGMSHVRFGERGSIDGSYNGDKEATVIDKNVK